MLAAAAWARSPRVAGVADVVAPGSPLGRLGSAVAVTAVLVGVQVGLVATHAGSDVCQSVSLCHAAPGAHRDIPQTQRSWGILQVPAPGTATAQGRPSSTHRTTASPAQTAGNTQTVAFRALTTLTTLTTLQTGQGAQSGGIRLAAARPSPAVSKHASARHSSAVVRRHSHHHATVTTASRVTTSRPLSGHRHTHAAPRH